MDAARDLKIGQLLIEYDRRLVRKQFELGKIHKQSGRVANWLTADWILPAAREQGLTIAGIDTQHGRGGSASAIAVRDTAMAKAIDGEPKGVAAIIGDIFHEQAEVKAVNSIAIVGNAHQEGLQSKVKSRFHAHFINSEPQAPATPVIDARGLDSRYIFPQEMLSMYRQVRGNINL